jgi:hypothetical protein
VTGRTARLLAGMLVALTACAPPPSEMAIDRWLRCEECNRGELDSVVAFGSQAVGRLVGALDGPSAAELAWVHQQSVDRYTRLRPAAFGDSSRYLGHYDSNFVASYQAHAAIALGRIGTPEARAALHQAMRNDSVFRHDVLRSLSRAAPIVLAAVDGNNQGAPFDSLVRVNPTVRVADSVTGQPLAGIGVTFMVRSGGGRLAKSGSPADSAVVQRTSGNGLASVRWQVGPGPDSANVLRAESFRQSVTLHATSHGFDRRLAFIAQPANGTEGQPLAPSIRLVLLDAWDQRDTTAIGTAVANIIGTTIGATGQVIAGQVEFPNFVMTGHGTGFRMIVRMLNVTPAISLPFDVGP